MKTNVTWRAHNTTVCDKRAWEVLWYLWSFTGFMGNGKSSLLLDRYFKGAQLFFLHVFMNFLILLSSNYLKIYQFWGFAPSNSNLNLLPYLIQHRKAHLFAINRPITKWKYVKKLNCIYENVSAISTGVLSISFSHCCIPRVWKSLWHVVGNEYLSNEWDSRYTCIPIYLCWIALIRAVRELKSVAFYQIY